MSNENKIRLSRTDTEIENLLTTSQYAESDLEIVRDALVAKADEMYEGGKRGEEELRRKFYVLGKRCNAISLEMGRLRNAILEEMGRANEDWTLL